MLYTKSIEHGVISSDSARLYHSNIVFSGGTVNTYGSWTEIHPGVSSPGYQVVISQQESVFASGANRRAYLDIGVGPDSGNVRNLVPFLCCTNDRGHPFVSANGPKPTMYILPLYIPPDTKIWGRTQSSLSASYPFRVSIVVYSGISGDTVPRVMRYESMGSVTTASTSGTATVTVSNSPTEGSWTALTTSTTRNYLGFLLSGTFHGTATLEGDIYAYDVAIGGAGSERIIGSNNLIEFTDSIESTGRISYGIFNHIPTGSRISARGQRFSGVSGLTSTALIVLGMVG